MNFMEKLTNKNKVELSTFIQENIRTSEELKRTQAILLLDGGATEETIKTLTGLKRATTVKNRKKYLKMGLVALESKRKEKKPGSLLTKNERAEIAEILHKKTPRNYGWDFDYWTPSVLGKLILELYGVKYKSKSSVHVIFKQSKFTFHKPEKIYQKRNQAVIDAWKKENEAAIQAALQDPDTVVLTEDEMIVTSQTTTQRMWLPIGVTPFIECSNTRKRIGFYGFLNIKTGVQNAFKSEKMNSEASAKMLKKVLDQYENKKVLLVWDNAPWHRAQAMRDFLETRSNLHIINFPPYAPDENPQEHVWKATRANVTHNQFISDIYAVSRDILVYLNNTTFKYTFFGFTAQ